MVAIGGGSEVPNRWLYIGGGVLLLGNLVAEGFGKRPPALTPPQGNSPAD
jgi:hypothetical protein